MGVRLLGGAGRGSVNVCRGGQMGKNVLSTQNLELYSFSESLSGASGVVGFC